jgi:hypothetical protein
MMHRIHQLLLDRRLVAKSWSLLFFAGLSLVIGIILMLNLFNPTDVGPNGLLVFFALVYGLCLVLAVTALKLWRLAFRRKFNSIKMLYIASVIAFAPVMLLALNTLNQLEPIDIILVVLFEFLVLFYIIRRIK